MNLDFEHLLNSISQTKIWTVFSLYTKMIENGLTFLCHLISELQIAHLRRYVLSARHSTVTHFQTTPAELQVFEVYSKDKLPTGGMRPTIPAPVCTLYGQVTPDLSMQSVAWPMLLRMVKTPSMLPTSGSGSGCGMPRRSQNE